MRRLALLLTGLVCVAGVLAVPRESSAVTHGANGRIAFESDRTDEFEIWTMNPDGGDPKNISRRPSRNDWGAAWSPDGAKLAWVTGATTDGEDNWEIFAADADGSNQVNLTNSSFDDRWPQWSPDGSQIVFQSDRGGNFDIWVMDADGTNLEQVTNAAAADEQPVWSPDGARIAFGSLRSGVPDVWVIDADGSNPFNVTAHLSEDYSPSWSPNGKEIAFDSDRSGNFDIWVIRPDGTGLRQVTTDTSADFFPRWSPDGTKLTFTCDRDDVKPNVWVMNADGTEPRGITMGSAGAYDGLGAWQPTHTFVDVAPMNVFHHNIESIAAVGITLGCNPPANTEFCPENNVTRGQMAAFLVRAMGYTDDGGGNLFTDDDGSIFEADIDKLRTAGVTLGCNPPDNTKFCPNANVTRGQMAAFLVRAMGYTDDGGGNLFTDDDGSIFEADIDRLGTAGVTLGCNPPDNTKFCPANIVTRQQMAAFLVRALSLPAVP